MSDPRVMEKFIEAYRNEKCLWEINSEDYRSRPMKDAAYAKLQNILKIIEPDATKDDVVKKIHNIRSSYRKECKRVRESLRSGSSAEDLYKPKLWYYNMLEFLNDQHVPKKSPEFLNNLHVPKMSPEFLNDLYVLRKSRSNMEDDVEDRNEELETSEFDESNEVSWTAPVAGGSKSSHLNQTSKFDESNAASLTAPAAGESRKRSREIDENHLKNQVLRSVKRHFDRALNEKEDRFDIFGKSVAMKLRDLEDEQRVIAEKIINDTLFEAEMGNLKWPRVYYNQIPGTYPFNIQQPSPYSSPFAWNIVCNPPVSSASSNVDSDDK